MLEAISSLYPRFTTWVSHKNRLFTTKTALSESFNLVGSVALLPLVFSQASSVFHAKVDEAEVSS